VGNLAKFVAIYGIIVPPAITANASHVTLCLCSILLIFVRLTVLSSTTVPDAKLTQVVSLSVFSAIMLMDFMSPMGIAKLSVEMKS